MAEAPIAPINPNFGGQEGAVAGNLAAVFTAQDRKVIAERSGRYDSDRDISFMEALKEGSLIPNVENEETTVNPHQEVNEIEGRMRQHKQILKHSTLYNPRDTVEIRNELPDTYEEGSSPLTDEELEALSKHADSEEDKAMIQETASIVKELKLNPAEIFDKFSLEQKQLYSLVSRIKDLHLKRLLTEDEQEFKRLSDQIKHDSLSHAKEE
ncbi:MAG: hypothetical protein KKA31_04800, partial [Candidatus Margulisbacteria bacterium]|nr:hypothetical protein [Candidatus Margulisiibacteriota bacterium]